MKCAEWILGYDTGISSKTIWAIMMGVRKINNIFDFDIPHDPSDFGRCYRLLLYFPEWRSRLNEVSEHFPKWIPIVREWDKMTELYEREFKTGKCPDLYKFMQELNDECMILDGWVRTSPYSWERKSLDYSTNIGA